MDHAVDLEEVLKEIAYFRGTTYYTLSFCNKPNANPLCPQSNFSYYANLVRSDCVSTMKNCSYGDFKFDCCEYFLPIETDVGRCYVLNSIQTELVLFYTHFHNLLKGNAKYILFILYRITIRYFYKNQFYVAVLESYLLRSMMRDYFICISPLA